MKRILIAVVAVLVVVGLVGGIYFYSEFTRTHDTLASKPADFTMNAASLYEEFKQDESKANEQYTDKILQVSGNISKINITSDTTGTVLLSIPDDPMSNIKCELAAEAVVDLKPYKVNDAIVIKGICAGGGKDDLMPFLDIELTRAVVVNPN